MKKLMVIAIVTAVSLAAAIAMAATDTGTLEVRASVIGTCRVITPATDVDFGNYDPTDTVDNTSGAGNFSFRCTRGTSYGTYIVRNNQMANGAATETLNYELYADPGATTTVFPDASVGTPDTAATNAPITIDVYGRIPALQDVPVDTFTETVTFTVEY
jgi:spore coat protein U-like protein